MKTNLNKQLLLGLFLSITNLLFAQNPCWNELHIVYTINFDDGLCMEGLFIDTLSNENNIWQIGTPQKNVFNNSYSTPNAIVTDTLNSYPTNDTSSFMIYHIAGTGFEYGHTAFIRGEYMVNSDSLNDFGKIELTINNGLPWYDIVNDNSFSSLWGTTIPTLTGNSNGWKHFKFDVLYAADIIGFSYGDTLKYRFTFISDNELDTLDGLIYDNFEIQDYVEGLEEFGLNKIQSQASPNPTENKLNIEFQNPEKSTFILRIFNITGNEILLKETSNESKFTLDITSLDTGIYSYILQCTENNEWSSGKIVKTN